MTDKPDLIEIALPAPSDVDPGELETAMQAWAENPTKPLPWHIEHSGQAQWAMARLARIDAARAEAKDQYNEMNERLKGWLAVQLNRTDRDRTFFARVLEHWMHENRVSSRDEIKSLTMAFGKLTSRSRPLRVEVNAAQAENLAWWLHDRGAREMVRLLPIADEIQRAAHIETGYRVTMKCGASVVMAWPLDVGFAPDECPACGLACAVVGCAEVQRVMLELGPNGDGPRAWVQVPEDFVSVAGGGFSVTVTPDVASVRALDA